MPQKTHHEKIQSLIGDNSAVLQHSNSKTKKDFAEKFLSAKTKNQAVSMLKASGLSKNIKNKLADEYDAHQKKHEKEVV